MSTISPASCPQCGAPLPPDAPQGLCPRCLMNLNFASQSGPAEPAAPAPSVEEIARHFPQLEILACLGRGGMGLVYKARQPKLNRLVALKILAPERERDPAFAERFTHEARALAKLSHPNIVTVHDFGVTDNLFYLVMEFVDGMNLRELLNAARISPREALAIVPQICDALQFAHDHGVIHRDIKPENILLDRQGRVKVADFGLAKLVGPTSGEAALVPGADPGSAADTTAATLTSAGQVLGTPQYMAPEQVTHPSDVDHRADIYSLGVVFYQMLTGELPGVKLEPPSKKVVVDVRLDEVVLRALEQNPTRRYQQVSDVKTMCETIAASRPAPGVTASPTSPTPRLSRLAIVGACWALMLFPAMLFWFAASTPVAMPAGSVPSGPSWWQILLLITIGGLGVTAPLGTTLLGWISVSQIRRSEGRRCGLGLAVFDGLLFPLLALDALIVALCTTVTKMFVAFYANPALQNRPDVDPALVTKFANLLASHPAVLFPVIAAIVIVVDFLIVRAVWRAVNKGHAPQVPIPGNSAREEFQSVERTTPPRFSREAIRRRLKKFFCVELPVGVAVALVIRTFLLQAFVAASDAAAPEVPRGSKVLVWKITSAFAPGDLVCYRQDGLVVLGRIAHVEPGRLIVRSNTRPDVSVPRQDVVGKVISIYWRTSPKNAQAGTPQTAPAVEADSVLAQQPPVVVETLPVSGARDVPPGRVEIRARFSKPMRAGSWSWCTAWSNSLPEFIGQPRYEADGRTCVAEAKLEPGRTYAIWLNTGSARNFKDSSDRSAVPYLLIFETGKE